MSNRQRLLAAVTATALLATFMGCGGPEAEEKPKDPTKELRLSATLVTRCTDHETGLIAADLSAGGKLAVAGGARILWFWSIPEGKQVHKIQAVDPTEKGGQILDVKLSRDGKRVAAMTRSDTGERLRLWEASTGKEIPCSIPFEGGARLAFSPDGGRLAVAAEGVQVWDLRRQVKLHDFRFGGRAHAVAFSADGRRLAGGLVIRQPHDDEGKNFKPQRSVRVWDLGTGKEDFAPLLPGHVVMHAVAFSPDGRLLAAGGEEGGNEGGLIRVWDLAKGKLAHMLKTDEDGLFAIAFSLGGRVLATAGSDRGVIALWDLASGKQAAKLEGHTHQVKSLAFSTDGTTLLSAGLDKQVFAWRIDRK